MGRKAAHYVTRKDGIGQSWFARRNGFHPNGRLSFTWSKAYDDSCVFTKSDAADIAERQKGLGIAANVRRVQAAT